MTIILTAASIRAKNTYQSMYTQSSKPLYQTLFICGWPTALTKLLVQPCGYISFKCLFIGFIELRVIAVITHTYDDTKLRLHPDSWAAVWENCHYMLPTEGTKWHLRYPLVSEDVGRKGGRGGVRNFEQLVKWPWKLLESPNWREWWCMSLNMGTLKCAFYMRRGMQHMTRGKYHIQNILW